RWACASAVASGFIRTQRSRPPNSRVSHSRTTPRVAALRSGATASSRSRMRPSAGMVRALASMRSWPPGTKWSDRRRRAISSTPLAHHGAAPRHHHDLAVLVERAMHERHDPPLRARARFALVDHFGLGIDGVAVEDGLRELD